MRIGYPCINRSIGCTASSTFRLASYSEERIRQSIADNCDCLEKILRYNKANGILFFRISSDIIPFASHPVCTFPWREHFLARLRFIGTLIRTGGMRVSMHPDQFVVLNSPSPEIVRRSIEELVWQCDLLDLMGLPAQAKVQIHVGGVYGDKVSAIRRFISEYKKLPLSVRKRLVIENDDRLYTIDDCMAVAGETGVPVLLDIFHHQCLNTGLTPAKAMMLAAATWKKSDGPPIVDYSSQKKGARAGSHAESIVPADFSRALKIFSRYNCDIMLEIKDKEKSAQKALRLLAE